MSLMPQVSPQSDELDTLIAVLALTEGAEHRRLIERALEVAAQSMQATKACVAVFRAPYQQGDAPIWAVSFGCDGAGADAVCGHFSSGIMLRALEGGRAFSVPSALGDPRFATNDSVRLGRITSVVCAPLHSVVPAVLCLQNRSLGVFQRVELTRVEALARRLCPLVERVSDGGETCATPFHGLVGRSTGWVTALDRAQRLARQDVPVLLVGQRGTGRRSLARAMHAGSARADGPRRDVHASKLTAAVARHAEGGTLVVDGIEHLTEAARDVLLQVVGQSGWGVRLIATRTVVEGAEAEPSDSIESLLFGAVVEVPSLADRQADLSALVDALGRRAAAGLHLTWRGCTPGGMDRLRRRRWPGNVVELEAVLNRAVAASCGARAIDSNDIELGLAAGDGPHADAMHELFPSGFAPWKEAKHRFEEWYVQRALAEFDGHRARTAERLKMGRATLFEVLKRAGAELDDDLD